LTISCGLVAPLDNEGAHYYAARMAGSLADRGVVSAKPGLGLVCQTCPRNNAHCAHMDVAPDGSEGVRSVLLGHFYAASSSWLTAHVRFMLTSGAWHTCLRAIYFV
jgi:hypothetical protein